MENFSLQVQGKKHLPEEIFSQSSECASGREECNSQKACWKITARSPTKNSTNTKNYKKSVFLGKKLPLENIRGTRWRLFCPNSWISAAENPNEFSLRIRKTYMIFVSCKIVISIWSQWYEERSFDNPFKITPQLEFFRMKIRKTEKFDFSKNFYWNSSSGLKEHRLHISAKIFSLPKVPESFTWIPKKELLPYSFVEKTDCIPLWTEKTGLRTRVFHRLFRKFSLNIRRNTRSFLSFREKTC